jgi:hypothetical protein
MNIDDVKLIHSRKLSNRSEGDTNKDALMGDRKCIVALLSYWKRTFILSMNKK